MLRQAACDTLLARADRGLDTVIGEGGVKVSGGEKQRLSIARALLRRPHLLVFDEATLSLDSLTEEEIGATIRDVAARQDVITILIEVGARLAEPAAAADCLAERELAAHECVQIGSPDDDVAAVVEVAVEAVQDGCVDQRERAARPARRRRSRFPRNSGRPPALVPRRRAPRRRASRLPRQPERGRALRRRRSPVGVGLCGHLARSRAATTNPSRISSVVPAGSQSTPDGTPNMTTARGPLPSGAGRRAIHGPAQLNVAASTTGTSPSPRSPSHPRCSSGSSGTSLADAPATCAMQAASVERSVWSGLDGGVMTCGLPEVAPEVVGMFAAGLP